MPRFMYNRRRDFLFRSALERLQRHRRPRRNGAGTTDITVRAGKSGGESIEHASTATASQIRWSGINASQVSYNIAGSRDLSGAPSGNPPPEQPGAMTF